MQNTQLYTETLAKLRESEDSLLLNEDKTWDDMLAVTDIREISGAEAASDIEEIAHHCGRITTTQTVARLGQYANGYNPEAYAASVRQTDIAYISERFDSTDQGRFHYRVGRYLVEAYARLDKLEGMHAVIQRYTPGDGTWRAAYSNAAQVIGLATSRASVEIAQSLIDDVPNVSAILKDRDRHYPIWSDRTPESIRVGGYKRLYRADAATTVEQVQQHSEEHLFALLTALQETDTPAPDDLYQKLVDYVCSPQSNQLIRERTLKLCVAAGRFEEALQITPKTFDEAQHFNKLHQKALLHTLLEEKKFAQAKKIIGKHIEDGPDRAQLRTALIDHGDIPTLRAYNLTDNGYQPRTDEIQIHVRRGDLQAAHDVIKAMPSSDRYAGHLTIAETLIETADPHTYSVEELQDLCTAAITAHRNEQGRLDCDGTHGRIFNRLITHDQWDRALSFKNMTLGNPALTPEDIQAFYRGRAVDISRLDALNGDIAQALHGNQYSNAQGCARVPILLCAFASLRKQLFRQK